MKRRGATALEYGVLVSLVTVTMMFALDGLGRKTLLTFGDIRWAFLWNPLFGEGMDMLWDDHNDGGGIDASEVQAWAEETGEPDVFPDFGLVIVDVYDGDDDDVLGLSEFAAMKDEVDNPSNGGLMRAYLTATD
jgi:Flp pilus assembly pilin Flp